MYSVRGAHTLTHREGKRRACCHGCRRRFQGHCARQRRRSTVEVTCTAVQRHTAQRRMEARSHIMHDTVLYVSQEPRSAVVCNHSHTATARSHTHTRHPPADGEDAEAKCGVRRSDEEPRPSDALLPPSCLAYNGSSTCCQTNEPRGSGRAIWACIRLAPPPWRPERPRCCPRRRRRSRGVKSARCG